MINRRKRMLDVQMREEGNIVCAIIYENGAQCGAARGDSTGSGERFRAVEEWARESGIAARR